MPKKKAIPPPEEASPEISESSSAEELPAQQAEAVGDTTETPQEGPTENSPIPDDMSGDGNFEESMPDVEDTADTAGPFPDSDSDEAAEDAEYDSLLQELNGSTPLHVDSDDSGAASLDTLFLEGDEENALPDDAEDSPDSGDSPRSAPAPAPAGRRDSYILTVDAKDRIVQKKIAARSSGMRSKPHTSPGAS